MTSFRAAGWFPGPRSQARPTQRSRPDLHRHGPPSFADRLWSSTRCQTPGVKLQSGNLLPTRICRNAHCSAYATCLGSLYSSTRVNLAALALTFTNRHRRRSVGARGLSHGTDFGGICQFCLSVHKPSSSAANLCLTNFTSRGTGPGPYTQLQCQDART